MDAREIDLWHMRRALELAAGGEGAVEPNPMVGCVIADGAEILGEGWHRAFGGPHAEVEALRVAGARAAGATLYVTLEPCCHQGKTPPCTAAVRAAGVRRVVAAMRDPFPAVAGQGLAELQAAGIAAESGLLAAEAVELNAPYLKLLQTGRPWLIAKWAMTLDGKLATHQGSSRWISSEVSRAAVHRLRGRVDAVIVGRQTAIVDDPQLTARPPGPRVPTRIVVDSRAVLPLGSQLVRTSADAPVLVAVSAPAVAVDAAAGQRVEALRHAGCEVFLCEGATPAARFDALLAELGRRRMTNVLVEGGGQLLGTLFDARAIDEVHVFIAPRLAGGAGAPSPIAGAGVADMADALNLHHVQVARTGEDVFLQGRVTRKSVPSFELSSKAGDW